MTTSVFRLIRRASMLLLLAALPQGLALAEDLSDRVSDRLEEVSLGAHELDISNWRDEVKISGWVSSEQDRQTILKTIKGMDGVDKVTESLQVDDAKAPKIILDDKKIIEARISEVNSAAEQYLRSIVLKGPYSLKYEMTEQGVLIRGELPAGTEKQAMLYHIRREVSTPVNEDISVRPWPTDSELTKRIKTELSSKQGLDLKGITVEVDKGVVTLSGKRPNHWEADRIATAALMVEGVRDIKSNLTFDGSRDDPLPK